MDSNVRFLSDYKSTSDKTISESSRRKNALIIELLEELSSTGIDLTPIFDSFMASVKSSST